MTCWAGWGRWCCRGRPGLSITGLRGVRPRGVDPRRSGHSGRRREEAQRQADVTVRGAGQRHGRACAPSCRYPRPPGGGGRSATRRRRGAEGGRGWAADRVTAGRPCLGPTVAPAVGDDRPSVGAQPGRGGLPGRPRTAAGEHPGGGAGSRCWSTGSQVSAGAGPGAAGPLDALCPGGLQAPDRRQPVSFVRCTPTPTAGCSPGSPRGSWRPRCGTGRGLGHRGRSTGTSPLGAAGVRRAPATAGAGTPTAGNRAGWADLDHVIPHADGGGDRLRQPVLPVPPPPPAEDLRARLAVRLIPDGCHGHHRRGITRTSRQRA